MGNSQSYMPFPDDLIKGKDILMLPDVDDWTYSCAHQGDWKASNLSVAGLQRWAKVETPKYVATGAPGFCLVMWEENDDPAGGEKARLSVCASKSSGFQEYVDRDQFYDTFSDFINTCGKDPDGKTLDPAFGGTKSLGNTQLWDSYGNKTMAGPNQLFLMVDTASCTSCPGPFVKAQD